MSGLEEGGPVSTRNCGLGGRRKVGVGDGLEDGQQCWVHAVLSGHDYQLICESCMYMFPLLNFHIHVQD